MSDKILEDEIIELIEPLKIEVITESRELRDDSGNSWCGGSCMSMTAVHFVD